VEEEKLNIAMFSIHSCPVGELGTKDTGGMNVYIRELASELGNRKHRVDIYTRIHDPNDPQVIHLNENVRVVHLKAGKNGYMHKLAIYPYLEDFTGALEDFIAREGLRYDLVHSHYWLSGQAGRWAQARWDVPHMLMFHTLGAVKNSTGVGEQEPLLRIATEKQLIADCHRIIAATQREKTEMMRYYGADPEKIAVVPCGVNLDRFRPVQKAYARKQLGFDYNERIVLYVGRFSPLKGIDRLLKAMTHLRQQKRLRLVIIGGDGQTAPDSIELQRLSSELGIKHMIRFAGRIEQDDLPPYYSAADLLVVPSYHESFGLVALESLACGTPVIATEVGAMDSIICEGKTGFIVADPKPPALAGAIGNFISKQHANMESVYTIRESVRKFSWSYVADAMIDEYWSMLNYYDVSNLRNASSKVALL
jgi:D-inositol-3-phosphate glycosyltransferase